VPAKHRLQAAELVEPVCATSLQQRIIFGVGLVSWALLLTFGFKNVLCIYLKAITYLLSGSRIGVSDNRKASPDPIE
jgi:hypothetical protein